MRIEKKSKTIYYNVYIANDGTEFENESQCIDYEKKKNGDRVKCSLCDGTGRISDGWHSVLNELTYQYEDVEYSHTCSKCNGKGYLERKEIWV